MTEEKKKNGRPLKYTDEFIEKEADKLLEWIANTKNYWLKDFSIANGYPAENMSKWAETNEKFSQALKIAKDIQETRLVKNTIDGSFVASMAIFALKNVAGYRDTQSIEHSGSIGSWNELECEMAARFKSEKAGNLKTDKKATP